MVSASVLVCSPAYAFPTPEVVWVIGGIFLKPALIFFPIFLFVWRHFEWSLKWLHLRAYANRKVAWAFLILGLMGLGELSDRIEEGGLPEPTAETAPLKAQEFNQLLQTQSDELQVIDVRSKAAFNAWHIENSVNLPNALNRDLQAYFDKHSKRYNVILCYGGDRSNRMAHYLRQVYGSTVIRSIEKGVFALRLQETGHEPYYVRQVTPGLANHWVSFGLARYHENSSIWVDMGHGEGRVGVAPGPSLPGVVLKVSSALRSVFPTGGQAFAALLFVMGAIFFVLIYRRKKAQAAYLSHLPYWFEVAVISTLTFGAAVLGSSFPEFYGRTAQQVSVLGEDSFSSLMIYYIALIGLPLTWHLRHTQQRKSREIRQRTAWVREGIAKPRRIHLYLNVGPILAFLVVVYFSVEVNCAGLWALAFTLWCTMVGEWISEQIVLKQYLQDERESQNESPSDIRTSPSFKQAQKQWLKRNLDEVQLDAMQLRETCNEVNGITYSLLLERLYPAGAQQRGLAALGVRTSAGDIPRIRLLLIGDQIYRTRHPLLEGFRAGRLEIRIQEAWANKLQLLWLRRARYWHNQHLLPLCQKHVADCKSSTTFRQKKRSLDRILKDLEKHFTPFQETAVRLHGQVGAEVQSETYGLGENWLEVLLRGEYTLKPQMREDWPSMPWSELALTTPEGSGNERAMAAGLHLRASLLILCLHDLAGVLLGQLGTHWSYGEAVFEMRRGELLRHGRREWKGMAAALQARALREQPWKAMEPGVWLWRKDGSLTAQAGAETGPEPVILSPARSAGEGHVMEVKGNQAEPGAVVVMDRLKPSELAAVREAKAVYCTRGSPLSHFVLVAREWGLPVFKITPTEKERLLAQEVVRFESDGSWRAASF